MSNSPLVKYTKLSPNHSGKRTRAIDTITIHCVVGHLSLKTLGDIFYSPLRKASCNYGIDDNGDVGMYVEESNRSWCSSSAANDQRAVTIEVASDTTAPHKVTDSALAGLISLCVDICQRNNIKKLLWKADKSLIGQINLQNMTVHRWFTNKSCPGDYLYERHNYVADEVNKQLGTAGSVNEASNEEIVWHFFTEKGLNAFAVAGLMGNLFAESGLLPTNLQNSYERSLGMSDAVYTTSVDKGTYANFANDGAGYGLVQWTYNSRKKALLCFAQEAGVSIGDLTMQLNFIWKELQEYPTVINDLKNVSSVRQASDILLMQYERPLDQSLKVQEKRAEYGQGYYDKYASAVVTTLSPNLPYTVKVTASKLMIRKGAGTNFTANGAITDKGVYTIVEEANGVGAKTWGRLKSGVGWISLDYTTKR